MNILELLPLLAGGKKLKIEVFNTSGTWTRPSGVDTIYAFLVGGGGGGGSFSSTSNYRGGGGGGGGDVWEGFLTVTGNVTVTIGSGGTGGTGTTNGSDGNDTTLTVGASATAYGGGGGGSEGPASTTSNGPRGGDGNSNLGSTGYLGGGGGARGSALARITGSNGAFGYTDVVQAATAANIIGGKGGPPLASSNGVDCRAGGLGVYSFGQWFGVGGVGGYATTSSSNFSHPIAANYCGTGARGSATNGGNAPANSGGGGGGTGINNVAGTANGGNGGSGKAIIMYWQ